MQGVFEVDNDSVGKGERQVAMVQSIFGKPLTLEQLKAELATAKPEPLPGLKEELKK
jgi:hypothetical protein